MNLLKISAIPPGAVSSSPATYDEADANPYPNLPDPLTLKNGQKVTTASAWRNKRRAELLEDFQREIYGRTPKTPKVTWSVVSSTTGTNGEIPVVTKQLLGKVDNSSYPDISVEIQATLNTPANATGPVPVIILFGGGGFPPAAGAAAPPNPCAPPGGGGRARSACGGRRARPLARRWSHGPSRPNRPDMAAAGPREGLGLRQPQHGQRAGRLRRRPDVRHHRAGQQGPAARARRLGRALGLGLGREPAARLLRDRQGGRRQARRRAGAFALRQGGARRDGVRRALRDRLHQLVWSGRRQAPSPQVRRDDRERRQLVLPLDGRQLPEVHRALGHDAGRLARARSRSARRGRCS